MSLEPEGTAALSDGRLLYQSVGGQTGIGALVDHFYERVLSDAVLAPFFKGTQVNRLRRMQTEFFSAALGGPVNWNGATIAYLHRHRGIGREHVQRFIDHLVETLAAFKLTEGERRAIVARIAAYAPQLVGT